MTRKYDVFNQGHTVEVALPVAVNAHTSGDVIGGLQTITVALTPSWHGCELLGVTLIDSGAKGNASTLYLFRELPSTIADDAAWTPLLADVKMMPPGHKGIVIAAGDWTTITTSDEGTISVAAKSASVIGLDLRNGIASTFYAYLVDNTGFTPAATDDWVALYHFRVD